MENNEEIYNPVEPNYYNYDILDNLKENMDDLLAKNKFKNIKICAYEIINDSLYPFLRYLLYNESSFDNLNFPFIDISIFNFDTDQLIQFIQNYLFTILLLSDIDTFLKMIEYKGFYIFEENIYVFFDLTKCKIMLHDIYKINKTWFCIIDELLNERHICNIHINKFVTNFFTNNSDFIFLKDENDELYEIPIVAYTGKNNSKLNFTYTFGITKSDTTSILGPYYYFTNYINAIKQCWIENNKKIKSFTKVGIIRHALFLSVLNIKQNLLNDDIDNSKIKQEKLLKPELTKHEMLTMRISDYDGIWAEKYDSIILNDVDLDDGTLLQDTPIIVLKNYEQQYSLSYHYIDNTCLKNEYSENNEYTIM